MIVFDLRCVDRGDVFEGWFRSGEEYEDQLRQSLIQCPVCESSNVEKAPMAPRVPSRRGDAKSTIAELAALQSKLLENSSWVGDELPEKARAMHLGEIERKPVHGRATAEQAQSLAEEGVPVLPLPLPVVPPSQVN